MIILILPLDYTIQDTSSATSLLIGTDIFAERLALYYMPQKKAERATARWQLADRTESLEAELIRINNAYLSDDTPSSTIVEIEDKRPKSGRREFLNELNRSFIEDELRVICFEMDIDFENIPGGTKEAKIVGLIQLLQRLDRIDEFIEVCEQKRPKIQWRIYSQIGIV